MTARLLSGIALCLLASSPLMGCGDDGGGGAGTDAPTGSGADADPNAPDADPATLPDAITPAGCVPGATECTDCVDNDGDGRSDGFDPECTGPLDRDEGSFATGIPGDNIDAVKQDCFFDGNSGAGNDGCDIHVCCLLGAATVQDCPIGANQYDPAACDDAQSQQCQDVCRPLVPPGCDCFGCCTVCDPTTNDCRDVSTNPTPAPNCNDGTLGDPMACPSCTKVTTCENACDPAMCILCPGQDPSDLPASCGGNNVCPGGVQSCTDQACPAGSYCSNGCCLSIIE